MRHLVGTGRSTRSSALWGGKTGRRLLALVTLIVAAFVASFPAASAASGAAFVAPGLQQKADRGVAKIRVIVQHESGAAAAARAVGNAKGNVARQLALVDAVAATVPAPALEALARARGVSAITEDAPVVASAYSNNQVWPRVTGLTYSWTATDAGLKSPTIAIVDSGIDAGRIDFGGRVIENHVMTNLLPNTPGDGRGHGTFVAGIAAGSAAGYAGAAPGSKLVMLDVMDDHGMAMTSDVIAAAEWIHANRARLNIRVANFSLHSSVPNSFMFDPLSKAAEKLWFGGVVVVAAAGNYGVNGAASGVPFAPGNDPFVITVGATDVAGTTGANDDFNAPWSAYGYTLDGFAKPEIGAPGRYVAGPVPATSTLALERPTHVLAPGYMQLSGTSFAAPLVSGAAAYILARHPEWTPDQVKGALMLTAKPAPAASASSVGVGAVSAHAAALQTAPPNPNLALNRFVTADPATGSRSFDAASWASTAQADASWASASWASASWASASWASASWASASWASASWASASWASQATADASWASASWASASWASVALADNASGDLRSAGPYLLP